MPHQGNERQQSVNDFGSCIIGNMSGVWLKVSINNDMAALMGKFYAEYSRHIFRDSNNPYYLHRYY